MALAVHVTGGGAAVASGCLLALSCADRLGRRSLLMLSAAGQCIASAALGTFFLLSTREVAALPIGLDLTVLAAGALAFVQFSYYLRVISTATRILI
eukprot:COSAG01_NODE_2107_length_8406_cov_21.249158_1_plen_97_part_00